MNRIFFNTILLSILAAITSCSKKDYIAISDTNQMCPLVVGHGGMGIHDNYPMNTLESFQECLSLGVDGIEMDVQMTKDCVLVAFHDEFLSDDTNLEGKIYDLKWEDLQNGYYRNSIFSNKYNIVSLEQIFQQITNIRDYTYTFDCKLYFPPHESDDIFPIFIDKILELAAKYNIEDKIIIESRNDYFLNYFKSKNSQLKFFILPYVFEDGFTTAINLNLTGITISNDNITKEQVEEAHKHNLLITVWAVKQKNDNLDAISKQVDIIQSDRIEHLIEILKIKPR